ncbi:MAG TPA: metallophosphoesterase [Candidatus Wallbacteria bacterium]|nr:metallophosphoesterase [Candidatus Wallbacteria bacterium]
MNGKIKTKPRFSFALTAAIAAILIFSFSVSFPAPATAGINEVQKALDAGAVATSEAVQKAASNASTAALAAAKAEKFELAIINDLHVNKNEYEDKERVIKVLNNWSNIDAVAVCGDLSHKNASPAEFALSKKFLDSLHHTKYIVNGNHDYRYSNQLKRNGGIQKGKVSLQKEKLERFIKTYGLKSPHYTVKAAGYLLVFLCDDQINGKYLVTLSDNTLDWLDKTLDDNKNTPTLIFCHAPLEGSLKKIGSLGPSSFAQPAERIEKILRAHRQVIVWTAGHTHMSPSNENYNSSRTFWHKQVHVVISPNLGKGHWVNTMTLAPGCVTIKTYDCYNKKWIKKYEKKFKHNFCAQVDDDKKKNEANNELAKANDENAAKENEANNEITKVNNESAITNNTAADDDENTPDKDEIAASIAGPENDENASSNNSASSGNIAYSAMIDAHEKYVKAYDTYSNFLDADKSSDDPEVQNALLEYRNSFDEYQRLVVAASNSD